MSVYFDNIIGNEKLKQMLSSYIECNKMPHAFIIEGEAGIGKKTMAKSILAAMCCKDKEHNIPCTKCINCEKIFKEISSDVFMIGADGKSSIGVEIIRDLKATTYLSSNELDFKGYIISDSDKMTVAAQNSFLKILEEPQTSVVYFLLCENSRSMLPTILSRAPTIRMMPIDQKNIKEYLVRSYPHLNNQRCSEISVLCRGNLGAAIKIANENETYRELTNNRKLYLDFFRLLSEKNDKFAFLYIFSKMNERNDILIDHLRSLYTMFSDILKLKLCDECELDFFESSEEYDKYIKKIKPKCAKKMSILIEQTIDKLYYNQGASSASSIMLDFSIKAWDTNL